MCSRMFENVRECSRMFENVRECFAHTKESNTQNRTHSLTQHTKKNIRCPLELPLNSKNEGAFSRSVRIVSNQNIVLAILTLRGIYVTPKIKIKRKDFMTFEICNITDVVANYKVSPKYQDVKPDLEEIHLEPHETRVLRFETSETLVDRKFVLTNLKTLSTEKIHVKGEIVKDFVSISPSSIRLPTLTTNGQKNKAEKNTVEKSLHLVPTSNLGSHSVRVALRFKDVSSHIHMEVNPSRLVLKPNSSGVDLSVRASLVSSVSRSIRSYGSLEIIVEVRTALSPI